MLNRLARYLDKFSLILGYISATVMVLMLLNVFYDVVLRYFFKRSSIAMQELEWHGFAVVILLGLSYTLREDAHVRVDIIYDRLSVKKQALINMLGVVLFIFPVGLLLISSSIPYVLESYQSGEGSGDPGGLPYRWLIKALIPLSFICLLISSLGFFLNYYLIFTGQKTSQRHNLSEGAL